VTQSQVLTHHFLGGDEDNRSNVNNWRSRRYSALITKFCPNSIQRICSMGSEYYTMSQQQRLVSEADSYSACQGIMPFIESQ